MALLSIMFPSQYTPGFVPQTSLQKLSLHVLVPLSKILLFSVQLQVILVLSVLSPLQTTPSPSTTPSTIKSTFTTTNWSTDANNGTTYWSTDANNDTTANSSSEETFSTEPSNTSVTESPVLSSTLTTETDPSVCREKSCKNGGTCFKNEGGQEKCICAYPYAGEVCAGSYWCIEGMGKELCEPSKCHFDFKTRVGRCLCSKDEFYNYDKKSCQPIDKCPMTPGKCKDHEICVNNKCECKEHYERIGTECVSNYCKALKTPCGNDAECKENDKDPENPTCICKNDYIYNGVKCVPANKCNVPGALECPQICLPSETCDCKPGYELQNDSRTCDLKNATYKCDKDCNPGICYKDEGQESCICPSTHVLQNDTCIDKCTAGSLPLDLCPEDACEPDDELGFRCKCEGLLTYDENNVTCRRKLMCSEGNGKEVCSKKNAKCFEDLKDGFKCECSDAEEMDEDGICKNKCELKKYQDDCFRKKGVCSMDGSKVICGCRPLTTVDKQGVCQELAISYSGNLTFAKSKYGPKSFYAPGGIPMGPDQEKMRQDLRNSMRVLYGANYKFADIVSCNDNSSSLTCTVELQFNSDPKDQVRLIGDEGTCIYAGSDNCFIPPALLLETNSMSRDVMSQTDPCVENIKQINCGGKETVCSNVPGDLSNFNCTCAKGFVPFRTDYPVTDTRTFIENCEDVDECSLARACPNRTRCLNTYGSYECLCKDGFRPVKAEADLKISACTSICDSEKCGKDGVCKVTGNYYACECKEGYTGSHCKQKIPAPELPKSAEVALISLATIIVPLALFSAFMIHKYRILSKKAQGEGYLDNTSNLSMEPLRNALR